MSEVISTGFKKMSCGDMHQLNKTRMITDVLGGLVNFQIVGTDPDHVGPIDGSTLVADYSPDADHKNPDGTFLICIESSDKVYSVTLADGSQFTITAAQAAANVGLWYPARILSVNVGTTGLFSVGY